MDSVILLASMCLLVPGTSRYVLRPLSREQEFFWEELHNPSLDVAATNQRRWAARSTKNSRDSASSRRGGGRARISGSAENKGFSAC